MLRDTSSPFTPGHAVPVEFFVGRQTEIERLRRRIAQSQSGRVECAFVVGERGIGKSSLAAFIKHMCEKDLGLLTAHAMLGGVTTLEGFVQKLFDHFIKDNADRPVFKTLREFVGDRITQVGLFGVSVKFDPRKEDVELLVRNFVPSLRSLVERIKPDKQGLLIILDDINGLANSPEFSNWFKSVVDEISTSGKPFSVAFVFVGLEERRQSMIAHQPSVGRIFDVVDIRAWEDDETREFYEAAFSKGGIAVEQGAMNLLVQYTGGMPVLGHEIGDAAFAWDKDGCIDFNDAATAVVNAAEVVGRKHVDPLVYKSMRSSRYRTILRKLTEPMVHENVTRSELLDRLGQEESKVLDNFLQRMKKLGVLAEDSERGRGAYRFTNRLHYLYLFLEEARARKREER